MKRRRKPYRFLSAPKRMIVPKVNGIVRAPEGVRNISLGQDYEKTSFGGRLVGSDRSEQPGASGESVPLRR